MNVQLGNRCIGDGHPVFIVFEAGPTHDGLASAKQLVRCAARAVQTRSNFRSWTLDAWCRTETRCFPMKFYWIKKRENEKQKQSRCTIFWSGAI